MPPLSEKSHTAVHTGTNFESVRILFRAVSYSLVSDASFEVKWIVSNPFMDRVNRIVTLMLLHRQYFFSNIKTEEKNVTSGLQNLTIRVKDKKKGCDKHGRYENHRLVLRQRRAGNSRDGQALREKAFRVGR